MLLYNRPASKNDVKSAASLLRYEARKSGRKRKIRIVKFKTGWNVKIG